MIAKTETAKQWAGGTVALGKLLGITHGAVAQWGDAVPEARVYQLRVLKPEWFFLNGNMRPCRENVQ